jgi:hypothetical protein
MRPSSTSLLVLVLLSALAAAKQSLRPRVVEFTINPNCSENTCASGLLSPHQLLYVKSTGTADTLHIFYSTLRSFDVLMFQTSLDTRLSIDWSSLINANNQTTEPISFSRSPFAMAAWSFPTSMVQFRCKFAFLTAFLAVYADIIQCLLVQLCH